MKHEAKSLQESKNGGHSLLSGLEQELRSGKITEQQWYERVAAVITPAYLAAGNPRAQSGHSGDETGWEWARSLVLEGVNRNGSFLDIGCANGHLMDSVEEWGKNKGLALELHGLDIAPELVALAKERLPRFASRIYTGNAMEWEPPFRFDFVRTGLEYVPSMRVQDYLQRLFSLYVAPGGRVLIGTFNEEKSEHAEGPLTEERLKTWGFCVAGSWSREHRRDPRLLYRVIALDFAQR